MSDESSEWSTRQRVLRLVVEAGPVSVVELARDLDLTAAGVRRHVAALQDAGQIAVHTTGSPGATGRGRPARHYVATELGQSGLVDACADLATQALTYLAETAGPPAVLAFADRRVAGLEVRLRNAVSAAGADVVDRVHAVSAVLAEDGYAPTVRPVPGARAVQLCQGHCPVQDVAARFPALCEAETQMLARVLGVHVQRLSTLAAGGHVCTTHVPVGVPTLADASDSRIPAAMEA